VTCALRFSHTISLVVHLVVADRCVSSHFCFSVFFVFFSRVFASRLSLASSYIADDALAVASFMSHLKFSQCISSSVL